MTLLENDHRPRGRHRTETDSEVLLSIRSLLRAMVLIWVTLLVLGGFAGYTSWQHAQAQCVESSIYSSDC